MMPQDYEPSLGDQESIQGRRKKPDEDTAERSLGDAQTFSGGVSGKADRSIGDSQTLGGTVTPDEVTDDTIEIVDLSARYKIEKTLGKGGMGEVLLATDTRLDRKVAIKRILGDAARSRTAVNRFLTEAKAIAALNHPNIVQIYDYGQAQDGPFLIMEYVDGESLLDRCRTGALPIEEAVELACQLCDGLGRAHSKGIIHRDIKPANILLTKDGIPKLTDFGLAKAESADTGMTMAGAVLGTLDFMPPEQRRDASLVDARSDLWSLAATLYQMVTGESPRVIDLDLCPQQLRKVLGTGLKTKKEDRYQSAGELKEALRFSLRDDIPDSSYLSDGQCPKCGTKNDATRRFCRNPKCGASLEVSCLSCTNKIPVWEGVCGSCGGKQEELATTIKQQKDSQRVKAEEALEAHDFALARSLASPLAEEQDPRLQQLVGWAKQFLVDIDAAQQRYLDQISHWLSESLQHEKAYDYASGIKTLMQVSESMREVKIADHKETVAQTLLRLNRKQQEVKALEKEISSRVKERSFNGLIPEVEKLLKLVPGRADMLKLKEQLFARNAKLQQVRDESYAEAEKAFAEQDYMGCLSALSKIDPSLEDIDILELRTRATDISEQVQRLNRQISQAIEIKQYDGLLEVVDQYLALQSQDLERQQLREQLLVREGKRNAQVAEIIKRAGDLRSRAEFSSAIAELRRIPESLMTEEAVLLEGKCSELKEQQQVAVSELRRSLDQSDFGSELNGVRGYLSILGQFGDVRDVKFEQLQLEFQRKQDEYRHRLAQENKRKENIKIVAIAGLVTAGVILIVGMAVMYTSYQRSGLISAALQREDYAAVLAIDPQNAKGLQLKEKAEALKAGDYGKVLQLDPSNSQALAMRKSADVKAALTRGDYESALRLEPANSQALEMKKSADIQVALAKGDYDAVLLLEPSNSQALQMKKKYVAEVLRAVPLLNSIGMDLKLLPPGSFTMGEGAESHTVTLTKPFYIGVYEVTQAQYQRVMGENPSSLQGLQNPVEDVSWEDAMEFCRKLSAMPEEKADGRVYRLPTEAEWEYACRAGTTTTYSFGDDWAQLGQYAWFTANSENTTHPVGGKKPNAWGLYDMHGNVWECCSDWYGEYPKGAIVDPVGPSSGSARVGRGGVWGGGAADCGSAYRSRWVPSSRYKGSGLLGFRVALSPSGIPK